MIPSGVTGGCPAALWPGPRTPMHTARRGPSLVLCRADGAHTPHQPLNTTERMFQQLAERSGEQQALGAGGGTTYADLKRLDAAWLRLRTEDPLAAAKPTFVRNAEERLPGSPELDVIVAGGTLGIFLAAALQSAGLTVGVVERGTLQGRAQEWNISKKELGELVALRVLSREDADAAISVEFNPVRVGFHGGRDVWTRDVLNLGVSPARLVDAARRQFEAAGGRVFEQCALDQVSVHLQGVQLRVREREGTEGAVTARLLVDAMGNQSPIVTQARRGRKPDGLCLVVGTCARGFDPKSNTTGDVIYTAGPSEPPPGTAREGGLANLQLFWEAFPAGSGPTERTTYMFSYMDASAQRPSLEEMLEHYWEAMPRYQNVPLDSLEVQRILFGMFPTYRASPLAPAFDRVLAVGDASGIQSPLSFGGFGALTRHLRRLTGAIAEAVEAGALDRASLKAINGYNPGLSGAWMLQRAMSIPADANTYNRDFINRLLAGTFKEMAAAGEPTLKPFLQDVTQAGSLARTLAAQMVADPLFVPQIMGRVGLLPLADWLLHFVALVGYTALYTVAERGLGLKERAKALPPKPRFMLRRAVEGWQYGAGLDYEL